MKMWPFVVGAFGATVGLCTFLFSRNKRRANLRDLYLSVDSMLSVDRTFHEDDIPTPEDIKYCNKVKERMKFGKTCVHPPLYGGESGADED